MSKTGNNKLIYEKKEEWMEKGRKNGWRKEGKKEGKEGRRKEGKEGEREGRKKKRITNYDN